MLKDLLTKIKSMRGLLLILLAAAGVVLIIAGNIQPKQNAAVSEQSETVGDGDYLSETEARIASLVRGITGRDCLVMLTLERGEERIYARDGGEDGSYVKLDGSENALLLSTRLPRISGAAVICGASESARLEIIELLTALLDLSSNRVFVK